MADTLATDLRRNKKLNVVDRKQIDGLLQQTGEHHAPDSSMALAIGRQARASVVVLGALDIDNWQVHLTSELCDGRDGHLIAIDDVALPDPSEAAAQANLLSQHILDRLGKQSLLPSPAERTTNNMEAYRYYSLGVEKAHDFQNAEAIELLKKAVTLDPHFAMAYARIGYTYAVADFVPEKGRPYLERASQMSANLPEKDRLYIAAWFAIAKTDYLRAVQLLNQITQSYPDESEAYYQLGRLLLGQEKSTEAIAVLKRGLSNHPNDSNLYDVLGLTLMSLNKYGEAIDTDEHYVALSPDDPNARDSLGMSYQRAGNYAAAISEYNSALALDPEFEPSIVHLGDVSFEQGRYREALHEYQRYVQVAHSNDARAIGYGDEAIVYRALGDRVAAAKAAANEMKNNSDAVWNALILASDENDSRSTARYEHILLAHLPNHERGAPPDLRTQMYYQASLDLKRGQSQLAIAEFKAALQHLPASSAIDLHEDCLANAYLQMGMLKESVAEYQRILQLNPNYPLAEYHLGMVFVRLGDRANARNALTQFLSSWQSADQDLPEILETKNILAEPALTGAVEAQHPGIAGAPEP